MENLTKRLEIRHALERELGNGAVKLLAGQAGCSVPYVSQNMSGVRANERILRLMANIIGCRVHGVFPIKKQHAHKLTL